MSFRLAVKTLNAIDSSIEADGGAAYRQWLGQVIPHMGDAYRGADEGFRSHMGASLMGQNCARKIWLGWRWAIKAKFPARILRLFNRGHLEEARFIALLLSIGVQVYQQDAQGNQYRISFGKGHGGGSGDGVGVGIPDVPTEPLLLEFKTHNDASFKKLAKVGVREAKFEHYVQMNLYMGKMGLLFALYGAVNKNDDALHLEIVMFDKAIFDQFSERGEKLLRMMSPPPKISNSPGYFECKVMCSEFHGLCHRNATPEVNCRTCAYSEPRFDVEGGVWRCRLREFDIPKEVQLTGCQAYVRMKEM